MGEKDNKFLECYQDTLNDMAETFYLKNERYGDSFTQTMDDYGMVTAMIRITDKFNRMKTLYQNRDLDADDEPIMDTMLDMANYLVMTIAYIKSREEEDKPDTETFEFLDPIIQQIHDVEAEKKKCKEDNLLWSK